MLAPLSFVLPFTFTMSNPNEDYVHPTFSGDVYFSVTITCAALEASDKDELLSDSRNIINQRLQGMAYDSALTIGPTNVTYEDDDLSITNEEEDFLSRADRMYEQANDK